MRAAPTLSPRREDDMGAQRPKTSQRKTSKSAKQPRLQRTRLPAGLSPEDWQRGLRQQFGREQAFGLANLGNDPFFSDFRVTNPASRPAYRVAIRGLGPGGNFCACPDYATNELGTCKHIEFTLARLQRRPGAKAAFARGYRPAFYEVYLRTDGRRRVHFRVGTDCPAAVSAAAARLFDLERRSRGSSATRCRCWLTGCAATPREEADRAFPRNGLQMSEYQYYEFLAIDRPLDRDAQKELRKISSRAQITATSFRNHYDFGNFRGDPLELMKRWFDLHVFFANWGSRHLMMRIPARFLKHSDLEPFLRHLDWVDVETAGDNIIVDIHLDEEDAVREWQEDGLAAFVPLRAAVMAGDLRLFYLQWLNAVQYDLVPDDEVEPLPGIGPLSDALELFADFFLIDPDLVQAAAEVGTDASTMSKDDRRKSLMAIPEDERTELLLRVMEGDAHVAADLAKRVREACPADADVRTTRRTAKALRARMLELEKLRQRADAERGEAERRRSAEKAANERRVRVDALRKRGDEVWREIEEQIGLRLPQGYDRATLLLSDLLALAIEQGSQDDFARRVASIRERHAQKRTFLERLSKSGLT